MIKASDLARSGCKYLGTPYSVMDCQAFVERCLKDAGYAINLSGSNAWYRKMDWTGTPEECIRLHGGIPPGTFLYILKPTGTEPEKYKADGIGDASHIGIYTGLTGKQMVQIGLDAGDSIAGGYNYGDGAINSSSSRGAVCTSAFTGKSIRGGWNRVGLWTSKIDYGFNKGGDQVSYQAKVVGGALNMRKAPDTKSERIMQIPVNTIVNVSEELTGWSRIEYSGKSGYAMSQFLEKIEQDQDTVSVSKAELGRVYDMIGDWLGRRG